VLAKEELAMQGTDESNPLNGLVATSPTAQLDAGGVDRILRSVRTHLGMDVAFVAEFRAHDRVFRHVDAQGQTPIQPGDAVPLERGFCQRVVDGRLPQLIVDAPNLPEAAGLPETHAVPIGSHLSVPIRLSDGRVYGTFCCFSFVPDLSLTKRDLQMMKAFADVLADQIDRDTRQTREQDSQIARLTEVMQQGQPAIVYQPIYDLETGRMAGVEGLSRFHAAPQRTPDIWFAEAAAVGLGPALESCAAKEVLAGLKSLPRDVYVAVNSSPEFIVSGDFALLLQDIDIGRVVLEITEHASISDYGLLLGTLAPLRALGLRIAVDDAGAGYASMRHILSIEPNELKLDISLTRGIDQDLKRRALASALIAFARETRVSIVAEGVETAAELQTLRELGVTHGQGYYLARPMPLADLSRSMQLREESVQSATDQRRLSA
jgi:EAL domain-containing protein (putative c-di-GMP-specific phosphodiesterase class I)